MENIRFLAIAIISAATLSSCDVLDQTPVSELSQKNFWQDAGDANAGLIAAYDGLQSALSTNYIHWGESRTDAFDFNTRGGAAPDLLMQNNLNPDVGQANWTALYRTISRANFVIDNVPGILSMSDAAKASVIGEALFLRALCYFYLVRLWGDVPLITESYTSASQEFQVFRTDDELVMAQILEDIRAAKQRLDVDVNNKGRATLGSVVALEAHVYAWNHDYAAVLTAVDEVLAMGYSLVPTANFASLFEQENASESIFELQFGFAEQELNGVANLFLVNPYISGLYATFPPSPKILGLFESGDVRYAAYFDVSPVTGITFIKKYFGNPNVSTWNVADDNLIIFRLADIILLKAEALNELGSQGDAVQLVNQIRARAGVGGVSPVDSRDVKKAILDERFRELYAEGHRWFDLVRTGMAVEQIESLTTEDAILWPISTSARDRNPNLTQNTYYEQ